MKSDELENVTCFASETLMMLLTLMKLITLEAACLLAPERTPPGAEPEYPLASLQVYHLSLSWPTLIQFVALFGHLFYGNT